MFVALYSFSKNVFFFQIHICYVEITLIMLKNLKLLVNFVQFVFRMFPISWKALVLFYPKCKQTLTFSNTSVVTPCVNFTNVFARIFCARFSYKCLFSSYVLRKTHAKTLVKSTPCQKKQMLEREVDFLFCFYYLKVGKVVLQANLYKLHIWYWNTLWKCEIDNWNTWP